VGAVIGCRNCGSRLSDTNGKQASLAVSAGANVGAVQRMLGHASAAMRLDVYADLFSDDPDDVAERLDEAASVALDHTTQSSRPTTHNGHRK